MRQRESALQEGRARTKARRNGDGDGDKDRRKGVRGGRQVSSVERQSIAQSVVESGKKSRERLALDTASTAALLQPTCASEAGHLSAAQVGEGKGRMVRDGPVQEHAKARRSRRISFGAQSSLNDRVVVQKMLH